MDVKSAFLYGTIDKEVYVMQPPGFQDPAFPAKVYKVEKAMYGLHQAPRAWYDRKSSTGGSQFLGRRLISWQCKKQTIISTSTTKAEYVAAASCCGQVLWIHNQLLDYGIHTAKTFDLVWIWLGGDYENGEFNSDFHPMVDFIAASPLRIETTDEGTHILATVDGIQRTVSESSLRRNLKLRDEDGIVSIPDMELFGNLTLMGYNISQNQKLTFQKG
nr:ribonuclease H-like domain, reverse transcriptase, RNA-dependent DNA polymerase [Tanacetum cinerariifolium]